jgi:hypothetical protein
VGGTVDVGALVGAEVGVVVAAGAIGAAQAASIPIDNTVINKRMDVFLDMMSFLDDAGDSARSLARRF